MALFWCSSSLPVRSLWEQTSNRSGCSARAQWICFPPSFGVFFFFFFFSLITCQVYIVLCASRQRNQQPFIIFFFLNISVQEDSTEKSGSKSTARHPFLHNFLSGAVFLFSFFFFFFFFPSFFFPLPVFFFAVATQNTPNKGKENLPSKITHGTQQPPYTFKFFFLGVFLILTSSSNPISSEVLLPMDNGLLRQKHPSLNSVSYVASVFNK